MSHYVPTGLIPQQTQLYCQLPGCNIPIPSTPHPPPFSLLKAATAQVSPSDRDIRRFFCSQEHRDQVWKTEKGWFDRRVAMPSERAVNGPTAYHSNTANPDPNPNPQTAQHGYAAQYQLPWARYGSGTPMGFNGKADTRLPAMHGQAAATPQAGWTPAYGHFGRPG